MSRHANAGFYRSAVRPILFRLDPEWCHHATVEACRIAGYLPGLPALIGARLGTCEPELSQEVAGLTFPNPVGLAAGWDKNGRAVALLEHLGFGSIEIGSISADPSRGNPKPRLFRLPQDRAVVVNYGLPNDGAETVAKRLSGFAPRVPLGINLVSTHRGPGVTCSADEILDDYARSAAVLSPFASYLTLNLSCPNTAEGPDFFTQPGRISELLRRLAPLELRCPIFLKVPPVEDPREQERWLEEVDPYPEVRGFIFNLPKGKPEWLKLRSPAAQWRHLPGAVAGPPVGDGINRCIESLYGRLDPARHVVIGVGGISTAEDAFEKISLGASLVQLYTALIYEGPAVVRRINEGLMELIQQRGLRNIEQAIGIANRKRQHSTA